MLDRVWKRADDVSGWVRRTVEDAYERARGPIDAAYERHLERQVSDPPEHVAIIQDGNRRYARKRGEEATDGHRYGVETTADVLEWCLEFGVREITLYAFSTENFNRPEEERQALWDLMEEKIPEMAEEADADPDDYDVCIRAIGEIERLPERARKAVEYAEEETCDNDGLVVNVALAYGGRNALLGAAREVASAVVDGDLDPADIDVEEIEHRLYERPLRDVDLIIRTGGDERTSNFLPWHANGNEAAVFFCTPYWPEFSRKDFLRGVRTYEHREDSWRRTRARRALALLQAFGEVELLEARNVLERFRGYLPRRVRWRLAEFDDEGPVEGDPEPAD